MSGSGTLPASVSVSLTVLAIFLLFQIFQLPFLSGNEEKGRISPEALAVAAASALKDSKVSLATCKTPDTPRVRVSKRQKIYTYYAPLKHGNSAETRLIELWKVNWKRSGWEPVVLDETHARKHPDYEDLVVKLRNLPSINPEGYELACYLRYLAVAAMGGGFMSDFDLFNYGFPRQDPYPRITLFARPAVPCLVSGPAEGYLQIVRMFANYTPVESDRIWSAKRNEYVPHVSDMHLLQKFPNSHGSVHAVDEPLSRPDPWERASLIHWSHNWLLNLADSMNASMNKLDRPTEIARAEKKMLGFGDHQRSDLT